jgi:hypothetical protein
MLSTEEGATMTKYRAEQVFIVRSYARTKKDAIRLIRECPRGGIFSTEGTVTYVKKSRIKVLEVQP